MRAIDHNTITDAALDQMSGTSDPRLKEIMESLVRHLHEFAREVDLSPEEWLEESSSSPLSGKSVRRSARNLFCCRTRSGSVR